MAKQSNIQFGYLVAILIVSVAVTGYYVGLQSPMNKRGAEFANGVKNETRPDNVDHEKSKSPLAFENKVMPATSYSDLRGNAFGPNKDWKTTLAMLKPSTGVPLETITISPEQKKFALALREQNRSYNGAPPTVPHSIDQMSAVACATCHSAGIITDTLRIPKMSHPFFVNCTQCHVESSPKHMTGVEFRENSFVGLPAPNGGPRAYIGAPPQIPHSVWMRNDCLSCHGPTGNFGIRTTHPWRTNCQQCHAPSSTLNQVQLDAMPKFLSPPNVDNNE